MIVGWLRLFGIGFVGLTLLYGLVTTYFRSVRREALEKEWDGGDQVGDRDAYIEAGMQAYRSGLRRKLILLVYIIPMAVVLATVYAINYQ